jgi:hypothetical protein
MLVLKVVLADLPQRERENREEESGNLQRGEQAPRKGSTK